VTYIPGLGKIPDHWSADRARWLLHRQRRVVRPEDGIVTAFRDGQVTLRERRRVDGFTNAIQEIGYQGIRVGDLVVHGMDAFAGAIGVSDSDGKSSPVVHAYRPGARVDVRYISYALRTMAVNGFVSTLAKGIRERSTAFDAATLSNVKLPVPPLDEQRRIVAFLDAETARINRLSSAMESQDGLLKQRRLRVLDSVWKETPNGSLVRLGYLSSLVTSGSRGWGDYVSDTGSPFFRSANLHSDRIQPKLTNLAFVQVPAGAASEARRSRIESDDVLVGITGANAGWVCLANDDVAGGYVSQHVCLVRPDSHRINSEWLALLIASPSTQNSLMGSQYGGTKTQLSLPDIRDVRIPAIPIQRQVRVVRSIKGQIESIDRQRLLRRRQINLLAERRQALITAAVTGQFDVSTASGRGIED
jgi:type I restriction enzyme S subunit